MTTINPKYDIGHISGMTINLFLRGLYPYFLWVFNMKVVDFIIDDNMNISMVQKDFSQMFPYLRLEFFTQPQFDNGSLPKKLIPVSTTFRNLRKAIGSEAISITPAMTINDLEKNFRSNYGLFIKVYRKSGKAWLETTLTNEWTLEEQNKAGEELSNR